MKPLVGVKLAHLLDSLATSAKGSYIFHGTDNVGKLTAAVWLAQRLNCEGDDSNKCLNCSLITNRNYPDMIVVTPEDQSIGVGQIQQLHQSLSLSQFRPAGRRIVIIDSAEKLTHEAQNALLKLLEEPPPGCVVVLAANNIDGLLPTVRSRCGAVYFAELPSSQIIDYLTTNLRTNLPEAQSLADLANGRLGLAITLAKDADARTRCQNAAVTATQLLDSTRFERLTIVAKLAESPNTVGTVTAYLASKIRASLRCSDISEHNLISCSQKLLAVERFQAHILANVNLRAALEGLVLEF